MKIKFIFIIQGEGRGHFTQAIAVYEMLSAAGHEVPVVMVGSSKRREIPAFVTERMPVPFVCFASPNFATDTGNKSVQLGKTICKNLMQLKQYRQSMRLILATIARHQPDMVINFYEPLCGLSKKLHRWSTPLLSIAHQYIYLHPQFHFPAGAGWLKKISLRLYTQISAAGADALLALSLYALPDHKYGRITISPPLLRNAVREQEIFQGEHYLVYLVNAGYMQSVIEWHQQHPAVTLHCFTDSKLVKGSWQFSEGLTFHSLDDVRFLKFMASAKGLMTTAGFETVAEAMYLGKPVLMVPVKGHFEQWCNARDGAKAGAGIFADDFNLQMLKQISVGDEKNKNDFSNYANEAGSMLMQVIRELKAKKNAAMRESVILQLPQTNTAASGI